MNQAFYPFLKLNKCSIISDCDNAALHTEIVRVFVANFIPGVWLQLLQAERYPLGFFVKVDNCNVELLIQFYDLIRVLYTAPGEVCNVKKAVHTTEVDKDSKVGNVLDHSFQNLSGFDGLQNSLSLFFKVGFTQRSVCKNNVFCLHVQLYNLKLHGLANISIKIPYRANIDL